MIPFSHWYRIAVPLERGDMRILGPKGQSIFSIVHTGSKREYQNGNSEMLTFYVIFTDLL